MVTMRYLKQAILLETGFTSFWADSPQSTVDTVHSELCGELYRTTFIANAALQRAIDQVTGDIDRIYAARQTFTIDVF